MKNLIVTVLFLFFLQACNSGNSQIQGRKISKENLKLHIQYLASAALKGRKTNEAGYLKAADYVSNYCEEIGLQPLFTNKDNTGNWFQQVPFIDYQHGSENWIAFHDKKKFFLEDGYFLMNAGSADGLISIESILFAGFGTHEPDLGWDDFAGIDIKGKYVMIVDGTPDKTKFPEMDRLHSESHLSLDRKIDFIYEQNAAGLIIVSEASRKYWDLTKRIHQKLGYKPVIPSFWADPYHPELPVLMIHPDIFKSYFPDVETNIDKNNHPQPYFFNSGIKVSVDVKNRIFEAPNVAGIIRGTDSTLASGFIVLGAHLDHIGTEGDKIFYGANDNASSCAALLEVAKELKHHVPKRSVIFVFYTAEEPCLWGSQYFVSNLPFNQDKIIVNLNVEMTGKRDKGNRGTTAIGPQGFMRYFKTTAPLSVKYFDVEGHKNKYSGSDQLSYYRKGIPAIRFGNLDYPEKHTSKDDISIINFNYLSDVAETILEIVNNIANE